MPKRHVWSLVEAREALERLIGQARTGPSLDSYLVALHGRSPSMRPTVRRLGLLGDAWKWCARAGSSCARTSAFAPLWVRGRGGRARAGVEA